MVGWKKLFLRSAGIGGGFAVALALIVGAVVWYEDRQVKPKRWNPKAIVATFDHPETEFSEPQNQSGYKPETIVLYYTLENTTDIDYHVPPQEQLVIDLWLKREKSLMGSGDLVRLDHDTAFVPAKQRAQLCVHLRYPMTATLGPNPKTLEEFQARWRLLSAYMQKGFYDVEGLVLFDDVKRYEINLPSGWS
jgi:hypothetical protein